MERKQVMIVGAVALAAAAGGAVYLMSRAKTVAATPPATPALTNPPPATKSPTPAPSPKIPTPKPPTVPTVPTPTPTPTTPTKPPGMPANVKVKGISKFAVEVTWDPVPGATEYAVIHPAWDVYPEQTVAATTTNRATVQDLAWNSPYSVWVQAGNASGWGPRSALSRGSTLA